MKDSLIRRLRKSARNYPPVIMENIEELTLICIKELGYPFHENYQEISNLLLSTPRDMYDPIMAVEDSHGPLMVLLLNNDIIIGYEDGVNVFRYNTRYQCFISKDKHMEQETSLCSFCRVFPDYLFGETPYDSYFE